jgi:3-oxoacyl-[acyl-carrier protein] reductase
MTDSSTLPLAGKRALVCGSTQGIGRACAIEFARLGASVTLLARNDLGLKKVQAELPADQGQSHDWLVADFADFRLVQQAVHEHLKKTGPVHILLNNTGGPPPGPVFEAMPEEFVKAFTQHVVCNQVLVHAVAPGMRDAKYGRIINIISTSVITPIKGLGVSNTIRAAVANWARTLAVELAPFGITVNNVLPGYTDTARLNAIFQGRATRAGTTPDEIKQQVIASIPARRLAGPAEIAAVAAFLASPAAGYVNGVNLPVDGGRLAAQ